MAPPRTAEPDFKQRAAAVFTTLRQPAPKPWQRARGDPEFRKLLSRIYAAIVQAQRLYQAERFDEEQKVRLRDLLALDTSELDLDTALEVTDRWDQLLIEVGDEAYLFTLLEVEYARVEAGTTAVTWKTLYEECPLETSETFRKGGTIGQQELEEARRRLAALYRSRLVLYSLYRARLLMKRRFLLALAPALLALVVLLGLAIALTEPESGWDEMLLAGAAGAVGATVSGAYKLRDQIDHINALREFEPVVAVQPLLGAAAGLFLLLVLKSGILQVGDSDLGWASIGVVAFVAGFSEPFVLGVVRRVTGIADEPEKAQPGEAKPGQRVKQAS
ncbi:MAG: hypothetical protein ACRDNE_01670 [Gaiellaceae bacterium]